MRIVFMGTPDFAVPALDALVTAGHEVAAVYTQPPRPGGRRGREAVRSQVHRRADELRLAVRTPASLRSTAAQVEFATLDVDIAVVAAYGLILPQPVLDAPRLGCVNIHASLLPRWRGAAPIQRAILAGDAETGVDLMRMEAGLDTGPILAEARVPILRQTAGELTGELAQLGASLLISFLQLADAATVDGRAQPVHLVEPVYAAKIDKAEARIDWTRTATEVERLVRAMNPSPGAWFEVAGERVKLLAAEVLPFTFPGGEGSTVDDRLTIACGDGAIRPTLVQRAGRGIMTAAELLRGLPIPSGTRF